jgi:hypothetical protein
MVDTKSQYQKIKQEVDEAVLGVLRKFTVHRWEGIG